MKVITDAGLRPRVNGLSLAIADLVRGSRAAVTGGAILASALAIVPAASVVAQDNEDDRVLEEVVVTGSRIVRQDFTANSPIQTVDEQLFEQTSAVGVETVLNRLPQFVPAVTQFTTGDVQQTATNTVGASTVSLRGLGANRNLVLINGRRAMPVNPTMVVDTNSIPSAAIQRVEVISGGASAVYGADAVGGVVNFILKDNYEGASVDVRFGDTEHGGDQTTTISALFGANVADDRGNVMMGISRDTRTKQYNWERDWRVEDMTNPNVGGGGFAFGSATWFHNEWDLSGSKPNPNFNPAGPTTGPNAAFNPRVLANQFVPNPAYNPALPISSTNRTVVSNSPRQSTVDALFPPGTASCPFPNPAVTDAANRCRIPADLATGGRFRLNRDGTVFTGLADPTNLSPGAYRFNGPVFNHPTNPRSGDLDGSFPGLPGFVMQPDGRIKENILYQWASSPREQLSAFANGHFDVADNVRVTGQAMVTRSKTESSLGLASANINQWGAGIPFGGPGTLYRGSTNPYFEIPDSLVDVNGNGIADAGDTTHPDYTINGRFGVNCDAALGALPGSDGLPGCTNSEAWPTPPEMYALMIDRPVNDAQVWLSREPDWLRDVLGAARSATNETTTMSFTLGLEGELPSGDHSWDMSLYTGRSDNTAVQLGSTRLTTYKNMLASPNYGRNAAFDQNPNESGGFAEVIPTCTSGLPVVTDFEVSPDCVQMLAPALKNLQEMTQTIFEANLVGDLAEMRSGPLQYALGYTYRENSFDYTPDNLSDTQNITDPITGLFPNEHSGGEFDVSEIYGELLIPIIEDGPIGVEHFRVELGARVSDWSMEQMPNLETYKALMDWAVSPRYRIRGGFNRAFRAPNLGELFFRRTQVFAAGGATRDWCSQNLSAPGTFSATAPDHVAAVAAGPGGNPPAVPAQLGNPTPQTLHTLDMCRQLMGSEGAFLYYDNRPFTEQATAGGVGIPISFGNPNLREEQADTWTIGVAMDILEDWQLTVDWYQIQIENMIALESGDTTYQQCLDLAFNPSGSLTHPACVRIERNPGTGGGATVERSFTNAGIADFSGVDLQLTWNHQLDNGGGLNLNVAANMPLEEITQDNVNVLPIDHAGFNSCGLQLQCQNYDYRLFTTIGYQSQGNWQVSVRHQYWPELKNNACRTNTESVNCLYNSLPSYGHFALTGFYRFNNYTVSAGIENLLDEEPPCIGANPAATPFPTACSHTGDGSTYDPLGRRFFLSMSMEF
jgi:outer membrane receptor protein involved in Fe transport